MDSTELISALVTQNEAKYQDMKLVAERYAQMLDSLAAQNAQLVSILIPQPGIPQFDSDVKTEIEEQLDSAMAGGMHE